MGATLIHGKDKSLYTGLQPRNYQVSKEAVHELEFPDIAVMQVKTICHIVTGILILIGSWDV